jgi:hypothetical protein
MATYDNLARLKNTLTLRSLEEKIIQSAGKFPNCKGLFPDCPEKPSFEEKTCRSCPKTEELDEC